jgi:hypothetical protein
MTGGSLSAKVIQVIASILYIDDGLLAYTLHEVLQSGLDYLVELLKE